jgi:hypothetical protein
LRGQLPELCSIINESLRDDSPLEMPSLAILARCINHLCLVRADLTKQKFPPDGCTYRGGELPPQFFDFYQQIGLAYRVPGFLATSFRRRVADGFLGRKFATGRTPVRWEIALDPRGRDDINFRCMHVNYLDHVQIEGEEEFLFTPYSVFTVLSFHKPQNPTAMDPVVVRIQASLDNMQEPEHLPLAPWY